METILNRLPQEARATFYRTAVGAEIDLVIETPSQPTIAIEVKRSLSPKVTRGFHSGCVDVGAERKFVIYPGEESYPIADDLQAIGLRDFLQNLSMGFP